MTEIIHNDNYAAYLASVLAKNDLSAYATDEKVAEGINMMAKAFTETLTKLGVEEIECKTFDPNFHNAVLHEDGEGSGETVIAQVLQQGYTMNGKLIRAAMVKTTD